MRQRKFFFVLFLIAIFLSGCTKDVDKIVDLTNQANQDIQTARLKTRDVKRISDANILSTEIQIYALSKEELPVIKDEQGNYRPFKLLQDSPDFKQLETVIKNGDPTLYVPADPSDPDRYYEYFSDGKVYSIKVYLEQRANCQEIKSGFCEYEVKGNLTSILKE